MTNWVITAPQPEAVEAGADILRDGGNAVDAAVACALVQTAVDPLMCGIAGFGSMQIFLPEANVHRMIDFHGRAPMSVKPDMWEHLIRGESEDGFGFLLEGEVNEIGYQSITTPMTLKALDLALSSHGTRSLADLLQPAIDYAENGFAIRPHVASFFAEKPTGGRVPHAEFLTRIPETHRVYCEAADGIPGLGHVHRNPDLAATYRHIATEGTQTFYGGALGQKIAVDVQAQGGFLSLEDLAAVEPILTDPLWTNYRGRRIATNRPPGGGVMIVLMLNILENFDLARMGHNSPEYIATVSEAMKIATIEKDNRIGDPNFFDVPLAELTSKDFAAAAADRIKRGEKAHVVRLKPGGKEESKDTTHISVVDSWGNCVALTHSIGMPSGVVSPGLGFMYNGCMGVFDPRPGRAGSLAPGKSRFTAMCPTMVFEDDDPVFVIGAPGGTYITMGVLQGLLNALDFRMSAQEACAAPRFCTTSDTIELTNRILRRTERDLQTMGYPTRRAAFSYGFAGVHAARKTINGWEGGADPGRDGMAISGAASG